MSIIFLGFLFVTNFAEKSVNKLFSLNRNVLQLRADIKSKLDTSIRFSSAGFEKKYKGKGVLVSKHPCVVLATAAVDSG